MVSDDELVEKGMPGQYISIVASENGERYCILLLSKRLNGATKTQCLFFSVENAVCQGVDVDHYGNSHAVYRFSNAYYCCPLKV